MQGTIRTSFASLAATCIALPAVAQESITTLETAAGTVEVQKLAGDVSYPWGMAFLPDGRLLVTERPGQLRILDSDNNLSEPLEGTPEVFAEGQGGLLDVALDPDFSDNGYVYLSFAEPGEGGAATALGRGKLVENRIEDFEVLFSQEPRIDGDKHFGGRIVFSDDRYVFLTMGERFQFEPAQDLQNHLGTIVRLEADGDVPEGNPFSGDSDAREEIFSYGHRNIEAAALHPDTGELWVAEMGPKGGDELNRVQAGENYGWPTVSWGDHYDGEEIPDPTTEPGFADAAAKWTPVISPSGMVFYQGEMFPQWQGSALIGGLTANGVVRVSLEGAGAEEVERMDLGVRIRDVEEAPDGSLYLLIDQADGAIWRLAAQ